MNADQAAERLTAALTSFQASEKDGDELKFADEAHAMLDARRRAQLALGEDPYDLKCLEARGFSVGGHLESDHHEACWQLVTDLRTGKRFVKDDKGEWARES